MMHNFWEKKIRHAWPARYHNLWHTTHKERQLDNNIYFYIYKETIRKCIQDTPWIQPQIVEAYKSVVWFKEDHHHLYIQAVRVLISSLKY
jgi:hypothetical protein